MSFFEFKNVKIAGISAGVPSHVVNNLKSERRISKDYDNTDFVATTGVEERRYDENLTTSDLCFKAAQQLIDDLKWDKKEIGAIVMVSQTLDFILPATACIMQDRLGLPKECFAEDIQLGCSGWVYGLATIAGLMQSGNIKKALLCAGDAKGHGPKREDPLFGFAGTVTALEFIEGEEGIKGHFGTDGSGYQAIIIPGGGSRNPFNGNTLNEVVEDDGKVYNDLTTRMNGMDVFAFGITTAPKSIKKLAANFGFNYLDADYFIFHQANMKMLDVINRKLKLPESKVPMCMRHFGNTSSASIPLTIVTQLGKDGVINNKKFICCGFGVGLSWGTIAFVAKNMLISKLVEVDSNEHML